MNIFAAILLCLAAATQAKPVVICEQGNLSPSCNAYTQEHEHILMVKTIPSERAKLAVAPTNASELTCVANYLGDRLPEDFYKYYSKILVKY